MFQDSSLLRHRADANGDLGAYHDYGDSIPVGDAANPGEVINPQEIGFNESNFTSVEDLGQFWLWNPLDFNY